MTPNPLSQQLILFFMLLILSALFSGSETAYFSINKYLLEKLKEQKTPSVKRIILLLKHPRRLLVAILVGNTLVNVSAASLATIMILSSCQSLGISREVGVILNIILVTFLILVLSEITPKVFAIKHAEKFAKAVSLFLLIFYFIFLPLSYLFDKLMGLITSVINLKEHEKEKLLEVEEFQTLLDIGEEQGALEQDEKEMLHSIFEFGDTSVREIMIPRTDMICVPVDISMSDLVSVIKSKGHTRIPVYKDTIDQIQGIINAKDLLHFISNSQKSVNILELTRPTIFVPESKKIDDLLRLFQKERQHMAIVVDEYGGTSGIVTLEDVIEEIVGEIRDEYDKEPALYRQIDDNTYIINAKMDIESLDELIDIDIPDNDEYETLGGFILEKTGALPKEKESIRHKDYVLTMEKVEKNRIVLVSVKREPLETNSDLSSEN